MLNDLFRFRLNPPPGSLVEFLYGHLFFFLRNSGFPSNCGVPNIYQPVKIDMCIVGYNYAVSS